MGTFKRKCCNSFCTQKGKKCSVETKRINMLKKMVKHNDN